MWFIYILCKNEERRMHNALTIDVEDYFQVAALAPWAPYSEWDKFPLRVERNTNRILELLEQQHIRATFFVLGWVAERCPNLVKSIVSQGHELASHGYSHQLVYKQSPTQFKEETHRSKHLLEDISGVAIQGYRAASYSITNQSLWALDILSEVGFIYDSSIFPVRHDRYGIPGAEEVPHRLKTPQGHMITEFPISTLRLGKYRLPIAGGGYFRLFPYWFSRWAFNRINRKQNQSFIFYLHPWELDPDQPKLPATGLSKFRHYNNLDRCEQRFSDLIQTFNFVSVADVLQDLGLLSVCV